MLQFPENSTVITDPTLPVSGILTLPDRTDALDVKPSKQEIRNSLKASTLDSVFSTIFTCITADVLLSNFLLELGASSIEIGILAAIPMMANFLQPIGAHLADKATSRRWYSLRFFSPARLMWMVLVLGIAGFGMHLFEAHQLIQWTLFVALVTHLSAALGSAAWVSWMAALVPHQLRGRYFGLRNSVGSLTNLICVPILGMVVSHWQGGAIQGYGLILTLAVIAGIVSLSFQLFMTDVNPQTVTEETTPNANISSHPWQDSNFLKFLCYYGLWMFSINLSLPFFNIYLLRDLGLDISRVTLYTSLTAGANVLMLLKWGKLADRIGNRLLLLAVGIFVATIPLFWLGIGNDVLSLWLWLPLLYVLWGGTWSAIDLCGNNLQMAIAPRRQPSSYFAIAAAVSGLGGALGTIVGGFLAQYASFEALFVLSALLRLLSLVPLISVREPGRINIPFFLLRFRFASLKTVRN